MNLNTLLGIIATMLLILASVWTALIVFAMTNKRTSQNKLHGWVITLAWLSVAYIISWCWYML